MFSKFLVPSYVKSLVYTSLWFTYLSYFSPFLVVLGNVFLFPYLYIPGFHLILEDVVQVTFLYDLMQLVLQAFQLVSYDFYLVLVPT